MDQFRNNLSGGETGALEQQDLAVPQSAEKAGSGKTVSKVRAYVAGALMAVSPVIGSCGGQVETDGSALEQAGGGQVDQSPESVPLKDRQVHFNYGTGNFYFEGKYPQDFRLVVYADGKIVFDKMVNTSNGSFAVNGVADEKTKSLDAVAYETDKNGAVEIPIEAKTTTPGMWGVPHLEPSTKY